MPVNQQHARAEELVTGIACSPTAFLRRAESRDLVGAICCLDLPGKMEALAVQGFIAPILPVFMCPEGDELFKFSAVGWNADIESIMPCGNVGVHHGRRILQNVEFTVVKANLRGLVSPILVRENHVLEEWNAFFQWVELETNIF